MTKKPYHNLTIVYYILFRDFQDISGYVSSLYFIQFSNCSDLTYILIISLIHQLFYHLNEMNINSDCKISECVCFSVAMSKMIEPILQSRES